MDKAKLKVLIKMILIVNRPKELTARQIVSIINNYKWGFNSEIDSRNLSKLLSYELKKHDNHFLRGVKSIKRGSSLKYFFTND